MTEWKLNRQFHTVLNCRDIEESVVFYKMLGFEIVHDRRDLVWPEKLAILFGLERAQGRAVLMNLPSDPGGPMIDLIEWVEPEAIFVDPAKPLGNQRRNIAFLTTGVQAAYEELSAKGVRFTRAPDEQLDAGIVACAFCYDPSGNFVELLELSTAFSQDALDNAHNRVTQGKLAAVDDGRR